MRHPERLAIASFLDDYERVRRAEGWGGDDLDLPFHAKRHREIWAIRQRTFLKFQTIAKRLPRGVALDVGAGNCWMTRYLSAWGFQAIAIDISESDADGLRAGRTFLDQGATFQRLRGAMERLPLASHAASLIAANASFHYAQDFRAALSELVRVLAPSGSIVIVDTPLYERAADGERMLNDRSTTFAQQFGLTRPSARWSRYLTFADTSALAISLNLKCRVIPVWPGPRRTLQALRARILRRRLAQFPIVVFEHR